MPPRDDTPERLDTAAALTREDLERRELRELAPYASRAAASRGRPRPEPEHPRRTAFQRDRDRIIHSTAFRRLQYKTQVFVNDEGDLFRTRLTHTLEVAQIARSAARTLRLNEDLVETIALAHDLGHAPFGHSGSDALEACMSAHGGFEHNRHALRIVDVLERRSEEPRGLNLTHEVRSSLVKHDREAGSGVPLLEAQLVDLADAVAYDAHDIDDALRAGLIEASDLGALALWRATGGVRRLIDVAVTDLVDSTLARLHEERVDSVPAVVGRRDYLVAFSADLAARKRELETFLFERVYRHPRVLEVRARVTALLEELFQAYLARPDLLPVEWRAWAAAEGAARGVCDYVAGMTDRFALQEGAKLVGGKSAEQNDRAGRREGHADRGKEEAALRV